MSAEKSKRGRKPLSKKVKEPSRTISFEEFGELNDPNDNIPTINPPSNINVYIAEPVSDAPLNEYKNEENNDDPIMEDDDIVPRRRGRKPKERFGMIKTIYEKPTNDDDIVILQLPISSKDLDDVEFVEDKAIKYSSNINDPNPMAYFPDMHCEAAIQPRESDDKVEKADKHKKPEKISNEYSKEELRKRFDNIKENNPEQPNHQRISKQIRLMTQFHEGCKKHEWPQQTDIFCFWCCNPFTNVPWGIPFKLVAGTFHVDGNFCSPECAAAYNYTQKDSSMWERYQLLNTLYNMVNTPYYKKLALAPPRRLLRQFGGYMTIDDFRTYCNQYTKDCQVNFPPMVPVPSYGEETPMSDMYKPQVVLIDSKRIDDANRRLNQHEENLKNEKQSMYSCLNRITGMS